MTTVYVETTVVGIIAARDHSDPVVFARQTVSREWHSTAAVLASHAYIARPAATLERTDVLVGRR